MRRSTTLICAGTTCTFLGHAPRYLRDHRMLTRALRENQPLSNTQNADDDVHLRQETRLPFRGRGAGGSRGGGGGGNFRGRGNGGYRGRGDGGRGRGRGYGPRPGGDDAPRWPCVCGAQNFSYRATCYRCQVPKPETSSASTAPPPS